MSKGLKYILVAAACWSIEIIGTKYLLSSGESSYGIIFWIALFSLPYWLYVVKNRYQECRELKRSEIKIILWIGLISGIAIPIVEIFAIQYSQAVNFSLLIRSSVLFTTLFALIFLGEKITFKKAILIILVLFGILFLTTEGKMPHFAAGDILTLIDAALISFGNTILGKMIVKKVNSQLSAGLVFLVGMMPLFFFAFFSNSLYMPKNILLIALLSISTIIGKNFRFNAYKHATASFIAMVYTIVPVFVAIIAIPLFRESLSIIQIVGACLILSVGILAEKLKI